MEKDEGTLEIHDGSEALRHENGMVKFWDVTTGAMRLIYELKTANLFVGQESESELLEDFSNFKWPPYYQASSYDPFEDDPRLSIKFIEFCPLSRTLCVGGNGGQVITFSLNPVPSETLIEVAKAEIFMRDVPRNRRGAALGTTQALECKSDMVPLPAGFQANFYLQCMPAVAVSAMAFRPSWGLVAAGISKGFAVANFLIKQIVLIHPTVQADGLGSRSITRMHSLRRSIRDSFRQRRHSTASTDRRMIAESLNYEAGLSSSLKVPPTKGMRPRTTSEPTSPIGGVVDPDSGESQVPPELAGVVSHLSFSETHVSGGGSSPAVLAATMGSSLIKYTLTLPDPRERLSQINKAILAGKDYVLLHAAPILSVFILDYDGIPIPGPYEVEARLVAAPNPRSPHYAVICTSEQIKIVSLPGMRQKRKEKVTNRLHEKIQKAWIIRVKVPAAPVGAARDWNAALGIITSGGTFLVFSLPDLKLCFRENELVTSTDHKALQSISVSVYGEILYLRSFSELERCLLCSYGFSYHSSMLPSLFAYEGSTNPIHLPKKSSLRRRQVVQVEVAPEASSSRERRSETPSPENMVNGLNISDASGNKSQDCDPSVSVASGQNQRNEIPIGQAIATDNGSARQRSKSPGVQPMITDAREHSPSSSSSSGSDSSDSESSDDDLEPHGITHDSTTFGNPGAMGIEDLEEGSQELDNIIASSLQQLENARAFYEHMQARVKKSE